MHDGDLERGALGAQVGFQPLGCPYKEAARKQTIHLKVLTATCMLVT